MLTCIDWTVSVEGSSIYQGFNWLPFTSRRVIRRLFLQSMLTDNQPRACLCMFPSDHRSAQHDVTYPRRGMTTGMQLIIQQCAVATYWTLLRCQTRTLPCFFVFFDCHYEGMRSVWRCPCCKQETTTSSVKEVMRRKSSYRWRNAGRWRIWLNGFVIVDLSRVEGNKKI